MSFNSNNVYTQNAGISALNLAVIETRDPTSNDLYGPLGVYPIGKLWVNTTTQVFWGLFKYINTQGELSASWQSLGGLSGDVNSLTGDDGIVVGPDAQGNINILGRPDLVFNGNASTNTLQGTNLTKLTPYVVGTDATQYRFTSIQAAINQAVADGVTLTSQRVVWVTPGTYTENVTFANYVNVNGASAGSSVDIVGNAIFSASNGQFRAANIAFTSPNTSAAISLQGATNAGCSFRLCNFNSGTANGIAFECTGAGITCNAIGCILNAAAGGRCKNITNGTTEFFSSISRFTDTASTLSGGQISILGGDLQDAFVITGSSEISLASGALQSGSLACLNIGPDALVVSLNMFYSSDVGGGFFVTGTGTFAYTNNASIGTANIINPTVSQSGLSNYTGNLTFDGGLTSISTDGQLVIGDTGSFPKINTLTAGPGVSITNGPGSITIASSSSSLPAFLVGLQAVTNNVTGDGTLYTMVYDTVTYDQLSNFSGGTTFTVPAGFGGLYQFNLQVAMQGLDLSQVSGEIAVLINGAGYNAQFNPFNCADNTGRITWNIPVTALLIPGDAVTTTVQISGGAKTVDVGGSAGFCFWSGVKTS